MIDLNKYDGIYRIRIPQEELDLYEKIILESNLFKNTKEYAGKPADAYQLAYSLLCEKYPEEKERFSYA